MVLTHSLYHFRCNPLTICLQSLHNSHYVPSLAVFSTFWEQRTHTLAVSRYSGRPFLCVSCGCRYVRSSCSNTSPKLIVLPSWSSKTSKYFVGHNSDPPSSAYGVVIIERAMFLNRPHIGVTVFDFPSLDFVPVWTDMLRAASAFSPSSFCGACSCIHPVSIVVPLVAFLIFGANKASVVSTRPYSVAGASFAGIYRRRDVLAQETTINTNIIPCKY